MTLVFSLLLHLDLPGITSAHGYTSVNMLQWKLWIIIVCLKASSCVLNNFTVLMCFPPLSFWQETSEEHVVVSEAWEHPGAAV